MSGPTTISRSAPASAPSRRSSKAGRPISANSSTSSRARFSSRRRSRPSSNRASSAASTKSAPTRWRRARIPGTSTAGAPQIAERIKLSPLAFACYSELGGLNRWRHIWAYKDAAERFAVREHARNEGVWPPKRRPARPDPDAGEHAGRAGILLAAALAPNPRLASRCSIGRPAPAGPRFRPPMGADIMLIEINPAPGQERLLSKPPANHYGLSRCPAAAISSSGTTAASAKSASGCGNSNASGNLRRRTTRTSTLNIGRGGRDPLSLLRDTVWLRSSIDTARSRPAGQFIC